MDESTASRERRIAITACATAAIAMGATFLVPDFRLLDAGQNGIVHLLLELFAIVVCALVVTISWHTLEARGSLPSRVLIVGFSVVAVCDLLHALTYEGMPDFIWKTQTERAIFFWLAGRTAESLTMWLVAAGVVLRLPRPGCAALALLLSACVFWVGTFHLDWLPTLFVRGEGVTAFKAAVEYGLCASNVLVAAFLWRRAGARGGYLLAASAFVMGVGELAFTGYRTPQDFSNVFGHVFKVLSYALIYRAAFLSGIVAPYELARESDRRMRESEARLRSISDNLPSSVIYQLQVAADGRVRFLHVSDAVRRVNGLAPEDMLRDPMVLYLQVMEEDRGRLMAARKLSQKTMSVMDLVVRLRHADGGLRWMRFCSVPRPAGDGSTLWDGMEIDVTERELAESEVRRLNTVLERRVEERTAQLALANRNLEAFAYSVAHDLRAPLHRIGGFTALLKEQLGDMSAEAARKMAVVLREVGRMGDLIDGLLLLARTSRAEFVPVPLDPGPIFQDVANDLRELHSGRDIRWTFEALPQVRGDPVLLRQVVANLLGNAVKFTRQRDVAEIKVGAHPRDEAAAEAVFYVKDNGAGFDMQYADKLFGVFQRLHGENEFEGNGIGLALVQRIVERHGGRLWATSEPGQGAMFSFTLPLPAPLGPEQAGGR